MTKIVGNVVGIPNPRPDWNQTDETKADYIKNKPKTASRWQNVKLTDKDENENPIFEVVKKDENEETPYIFGENTIMTGPFGEQIFRIHLECNTSFTIGHAEGVGLIVNLMPIGAEVIEDFSESSYSGELSYIEVITQATCTLEFSELKVEKAIGGLLSDETAEQMFKAFDKTIDARATWQDFKLTDKDENGNPITTTDATHDMISMGDMYLNVGTVTTFNIAVNGHISMTFSRDIDIIVKVDGNILTVNSYEGKVDTGITIEMSAGHLISFDKLQKKIYSGGILSDEATEQLFKVFDKSENTYEKGEIDAKLVVAGKVLQDFNLTDKDENGNPIVFVETPDENYIITDKSIAAGPFGEVFTIKMNGYVSIAFSFGYNPNYDSYVAVDGNVISDLFGGEYEGEVNDKIEISLNSPGSDIYFSKLQREVPKGGILSDEMATQMFNTFDKVAKLKNANRVLEDFTLVGITDVEGSWMNSISDNEVSAYNNNGLTLTEFTIHITGYVSLSIASKQNAILKINGSEILDDIYEGYVDESGILVQIVANEDSGSVTFNALQKEVFVGGILSDETAKQMFGAIDAVKDFDKALDAAIALCDSYIGGES